MDASIYATSPKYKGFFRPNLSSKGPYSNWPMEIPIKKLDNESETLAVVVCRSSAIAVNPGKYISIENGPIADKVPRMRIVKNRFLVVINYHSKTMAED